MTPDYQVEVDKVTPAEWDDLLGCFDDASVYQTWAYGAIHWGEKQLSHVVLKHSGMARAAAQVRLVTMPVLGSGVAYVRWAPLWRRKDHPRDTRLLEKIIGALRAEYVERRGLMLRLLPAAFAGDADEASWTDALRAFGFQRDDRHSCYRTIRVDVASEPDIVRKRLDGKWRNQLNAAERNGLIVSEGTDDDIYDAFLGLYDEMMARKRFESTVDPRRFRRMQQRLSLPHKMLVMIGTKNGVPQSGLVATAVGRVGIYLLGATSNEGMKSKGSYLLQWRMLLRLRESGCAWYDLGGINPDRNPGVYHFKQGMGGQEVTGLGQYTLSTNLLSTAFVTGAERLQMAVKRIRAISKERSGAVIQN